MKKEDRDIIIFDLDGTLVDCEHRRHFVEPPIVELHWGKQCGWTHCEQPVGKPHKKECSSFYDWKPDWESFFREDLIMQDKLLRPAAMVYQHFQATHQIIICTGRMEKHRAISDAWLDKHDIFYDHFFLRADDDYREDFVVKQILLDHMIAEFGREKILFALDDRNQTVAMWRRNNIPCLQVAEGNF